MMQRTIEKMVVVFKTHLDAGYTDYAHAVKMRAEAGPIWLAMSSGYLYVMGNCVGRVPG